MIFALLVDPRFLCGNDLEEFGGYGYLFAWHNEAVFGKSRRFAPLVLNDKIVEDIALVGSNGDLNLVVELCL